MPQQTSHPQACLSFSTFSFRHVVEFLAIKHDLVRVCGVEQSDRLQKGRVTDPPSSAITPAQHT